MTKAKKIAFYTLLKGKFPVRRNEAGLVCSINYYAWFNLDGGIISEFYIVLKSFYSAQAQCKEDHTVCFDFLKLLHSLSFK